MHQNILDAIQRHVQHIITERTVVLGKFKRIISILDRVEQIGQFTDILKMEANDLNDRNNPDNQAKRHQYPLLTNSHPHTRNNRPDQPEQQSAQLVYRTSRQCHLQSVFTYFVIECLSRDSELSGYGRHVVSVLPDRIANSHTFHLL